ncbi:hypothetical protein SteCoe_9719 [Stentor coeruleus]|uniref:Uncharacterized protein n=1 Tax=Stentor coeruleus TaxID=5963 RepID=A0A1R2CHH1_9CILI|nr:hypothetical protein SteCoe_9719 [Stentor coeruleus]
MSFFALIRKSIRDLNVKEHIEEIKKKHQASLDHKMKIRELMKKIIRMWLNVKKSRYWRHWSRLKFMPTSYEKMKFTWRKEVESKRKKQKINIKISREKITHRASFNANQMRLSRETSARIINDRISRELHKKVAMASQIKRVLATGAQSSRAKLLLNRISSANQVRSQSRMRYQSIQLSID